MNPGRIHKHIHLPQTAGDSRRAGRHDGSDRGTAVTALRIVSGETGTGFFLFRPEAAGGELADTWHESLDAAMAQAQYEYGTRPLDWNDASTD